MLRMAAAPMVLPALVWGCVGSSDDKGPTSADGSGDGAAGTGSSVIQACGSACQAQATSGCPLAVPLTDCVNACTDSSLTNGCDAEWAAFQSCLGRATVTCDTDGYPEIRDACTEEVIAFYDCSSAVEGVTSECRTTGNCGSAEVCDETTGACVPCAESDHCETLTNPNETAWDPEACESSDDCFIGACDLTSGRCVDCTEDAHCASSLASICRMDTMECVQCTSDEHCDEYEPVCDTEANRCERCLPDRCDGVCDSLFGCVECLQSSDCESNQECQLNRCLMRCLEDGDCPGSACGTSGLCEVPIGTPCGEAGASCYPGGTCIEVNADLETVEGYCSRSCFAPQDCPAGYTCQNQDCRRNDP